MASRILGMGDVLTLIEKAQTTIDEKKTGEMMNKLKESSFDMNDLLEYMSQIKKMGPLKQIVNMIPGVGGKIKDEDIDDRQMVRLEAMITSMTKAERENPKIINPSRKRRIATGSGTKVEDVNRCLLYTSFVDGILRIGNRDLDALATMVEKVQGIVKDDVAITLTVSTDPENLPESLKAYL